MINPQNPNLFLLLAVIALLLPASLLADSSFTFQQSAAEYEVWASDQSNSVGDINAAGTSGSYLWIWRSPDIKRQLAGGDDARPISCSRSHGKKNAAITGPCDLLEVFPQTLVEVGADAEPTGNVLADLPGFGRLHGMLPDPQNRYVNVNIFAPGGGYIGVIDTRKKEAIALFRVTGTNVGGGSDVRSVHMSFWNSDGSAILVANLNGKLLERIDIKRNGSGKIKQLYFNQSASLGVGKDMAVTAAATVFHGENAHGRKMLGKVVGNYQDMALADLTPNGLCKENDCVAGSNADLGGRPNNVIICPIISSSDKAYITMGGGGLLVADTRATPMTIVGEYGNQVINGAGCGGAEAGDQMWLNAGVSASSAGANQSTFTLYSLDDAEFSTVANPPDAPMPTLVFKDDGNTATIGNVESIISADDSGQLPGTTTRRDAHGMVATLDGEYIHTVDRIQNLVEVFHTGHFGRSTYDLITADGLGNGVGACAAKSVTDDAGLPGNDPAPDLLDRTPDGKHLMIALRGPAPVSVTHAAQGSCPGVGIVKLTSDGASGHLVGILRTTNSVDNSAASAPGGHAYSGAERSDIHGATVVCTRHCDKGHASKKHKKHKKFKK